MWRCLLAALLAWSLVAPTAQAQEQLRDHVRFVAERRYDRDESRRRDRRSEQREERRRADRPQREFLTPDEHRELNRDLRRANREIYRKDRERR